MTCRLPQTPRTPTAAAAHYFDDVFTAAGKPKKPYQLRRSSTSRSIGFRSDWESGNDEDDEEGGMSPIKRKNSVGYLDEEAIKQKQAMEERLNHYVSGQLERVKTGMGDVDQDEFETTYDGASERRGRTNGNGRRARGGYFEEDPYFSK